MNNKDKVVASFIGKGKPLTSPKKIKKNDTIGKPKKGK